MPLTWSVSLWENGMMKIKNVQGAIQSNNVVFAGFNHVKFWWDFLLIYISKPQQIYLVLEIHTEIFLWEFSMPESVWSQFKTLLLQLVPRTRGQSKVIWDGLHWYIDCYALERHWGVTWEKLEQKLCQKKNFDRKWIISVYNWQNVKLL